MAHLVGLAGPHIPQVLELLPLRIHSSRGRDLERARERDREFLCSFGGNFNDRKISVSSHSSASNLNVGWRERERISLFYGGNFNNRKIPVFNHGSASNLNVG